MSPSIDSGKSEVTLKDVQVTEPVFREYGENLAWNGVRRTLSNFFSEFLGTFVLILFGLGSIAQVVLSKDQKGTYIATAWGMAIGLMMGAYVAAKSGGHLNPAVTLAMCVYRKHPWRQLPVYIAGQFLGAFLAAAVVYGNYESAINVFEGGPHLRTVPSFSPNATAGVFATYPQPFVTRTGQFFSEFIATAILYMGILALSDRQYGAGKLMPLGLLILVFGLGLAFGFDTGYAMNPARDFAPRVFTWFAGYGLNVFRASGTYFWIPIVGPFLGALFGGFLFDLFIYTGESPINTPFLGLQRLVNPRAAKQFSPV